MTIRIARVARDLSAWAGARQQQLSDRVHARDEVLARACGWEVAVGTGRLGFGDRVYRDPRFGQRVVPRLFHPVPGLVPGWRRPL